MSARILTMAALLGSIVFSPVAAQGKTNFSGAWKLNTEKSDPMGGMGGGGGGGMGMGNAVTTITQTDTKLTIESKFGDQVRTSTYNLDGSESVNPGRNGDNKSKLHWDGASIVIETVSASGSTSKEVRTLSADGKTMTVVRTSQGPNGETTRKTVYDKQ
ncbi:MAG TPA: hypothetical protein VGP61_08720 [Gemmatimonadales bacterium]|jgi:D-arabinose 1-dehydrogenase-like Zn-dependent alcohol dehydrogenase|nr:hypothetical protein [Gemmatimonadales bacterium]